MKRIVLFVLAFCLVFVGVAFPGEFLDLVTPKEVKPSANQIQVDWYMIKPGSTKQLWVQFDWFDSVTGQYIFQDAKIVIENIEDDPVTPQDETTTDWDDIMAYVIQCPGDAGKVLGPSLRQYIWNKMEQQLGVTFQ
ncbi:MAG: hypothetical protein ACXABY_21550 [Candidatus Thorarchaeota archaeon]|jgi:hypothetical protein